MANFIYNNLYWKEKYRKMTFREVMESYGYEDEKTNENRKKKEVNHGRKQ